MRTKVDSSGRLVIPARFRRQLGIADGGGEVELIDTPDGVLLRHIGPPVPGETRGAWRSWSWVGR